MAGGVAGAENANGGNVFDVYGLGVDYQRTLDSEFKFEDLERKVNGELNIGELRFDSSDGKIHTVNSHDFWTILNHKKLNVGENAATRSAIKKLLDDKFGSQDELRDVLAEISERLTGGANARKPISRDEVRVMINLLKHEEGGMTGGKILSREQVRAQLDISERLKTSGPAVRRAWEGLNGQTIANYIKGWGRSSVLNDVSDNVRTSLKGERTVNDPKVALKNYFFEAKRVSNDDESTIDGIFTEALLNGGDARRKIEAVKKSFLDSIDEKLESSDCVSDRMVDEFAAEVGKKLKPVLDEIARGSDVPGVDFLKRQVNGLSLSRSGSSMFYISDSDAGLRGLNEKITVETARREKVHGLSDGLKVICSKKALPDDRVELLRKVNDYIKEFPTKPEVEETVFQELKTLLESQNPVNLADEKNIEALQKLRNAVNALNGRLQGMDAEIARLTSELVDSMQRREPFFKQELEREKDELDKLRRQLAAKTRAGWDIGDLSAEISKKEAIVAKLEDVVERVDYSSLNGLSKLDTLETLALKKDVKTMEARIKDLTKKLQNTGVESARARISGTIENCRTQLRRLKEDVKTGVDNVAASAASGRGMLVNRQELKAQMKKWFAAVVHANAKAALDSLFANCGTEDDLRAVLDRPGVYGFLSTFAGKGADGLIYGMMNGKPDLYDATMLGKYNFKSAISDMGDAVEEWTEVVMAANDVRQTNKAVILSLSEYMRIKAATLQPWQSDSLEAQDVLPISTTFDLLNNEVLHDDGVEMLISGNRKQPQYDRVEKLPLENIVRIACGKKDVARALVVDWLKRHAPDFVSFKLKQLVHFHHLLKPLKRSQSGDETKVYEYDVLPENSAHFALEEVRRAKESFDGNLSMDYPVLGKTRVSYGEDPMGLEEISVEQDAVQAENLAREIERAIKRLLRGTDVENVDEILLGSPEKIDHVFGN